MLLVVDDGGSLRPAPEDHMRRLMALENVTPQGVTSELELEGLSPSDPGYVSRRTELMQVRVPICMPPDEQCIASAYTVRPGHSSKSSSSPACPHCLPSVRRSTPFHQPYLFLQLFIKDTRAQLVKVQLVQVSHGAGTGRAHGDRTSWFCRPSPPTATIVRYI